MKRLLIFGYGYTGRALARTVNGAWTVAATSRRAEVRAEIAAAGLQAVDPHDPRALREALVAADALLVSAPPEEAGCPAAAALGPHWPQNGGPRWIGYLSTTGVYGDRGGGWVREDSSPAPASPEARRRAQAEDAWTELCRTRGARLAVLRLPGIYGPDRSALDRTRAGEAQRWTKPGQIFSRIHVDDLAAALALALERPDRASGIFTLCDDEPAPPSEVSAHAHSLLGRLPPPERLLDPATLSPMARRFWSESKRIPNARAKAALGWRPSFPSYREGLAAILAAETSDR